MVTFRGMQLYSQTKPRTKVKLKELENLDVLKLALNCPTSMVLQIKQ
jgi:hypothetical protein